MAPPPPPPPSRPPLSWLVRLLIGAVSALHTASLRRDGTVNRFLLSLLERTVAAGDSAGVSSSDHVVSDEGIRARMFFPAAAGAGDCEGGLPVLVYFHGGGFVCGSAVAAPYDALCRRLAAAVPAVVASVDYRLAPEHRFPAPYEDGEAAVRWALAGAGGALPSPPAAVFVAGDSAGGNIAHHVVARLPRSSIAGLVSIQPFFAGEEPTASEQRLPDTPFGSPERRAWMWRAFLPPGATLDHDAANVAAAIRRSAAAAAEDVRAFPPTMVCIGGWDVHQDRQREYAEALRAAGAEDVRVAEFPDAIHAFYLLPGLAGGEKLAAEVAEFVNCRAERLRNARSGGDEQLVLP